MTEYKFQQLLLYILLKANKSLHLAVFLRTIVNTAKCNGPLVQAYNVITMNDGKKYLYIHLVKGFDPSTEMNQNYPSFYQPFTFADLIVSSDKNPDMKDFTNNEINCLDQSIAKNKDYIYVSNSGSDCICVDWLF